MTTRTTEERHRLSVIRILYERIQATSTERITLAEISASTGISASNLSKWLKEEVVPRKSSFRIAEQALLTYLNSLLPEQTVHYAEAELQPRTEVLSVSENLLRGSIFNLESLAVGFAIGFTVGAIAIGVVALLL